MTDPSPIPTGALLLHIGPQKTGSTAIQMSMHENRADLAAQGVLYPGQEMRPREAGWAVLGGGSAVGRPAPRMQRWTELLEELRASSLPRVCVSNEDFGRADEAAIERIMSGLGSENTHLVLVARRLDKLLPSHWQERVKARMTLDYEAFLHHVLDDPDRDWESRVTWEPHDIRLLLSRWGAYIPPERTTVIVSDEADRQLIPHAFESLLGLEPGTLKPPRENSNTSLTFTQTEAVRAVNAMARAEEWSQEQYWRIVQAGVVKDLRSAPDEGGPRITGLPAWAHALVADRSDAQADAIRDAGVNVVGDPDRLRIRETVAPADVPPPLTSVPLDLLGRVVRGAVDGSASLHRRELRAAVRQARAESHPSGRELVRMLGARVLHRFRG